ncbi:MAG TPA: helix-turn-helix transcriptional regulator [Rhodanobacteraceae bacterium]
MLRILFKQLLDDKAFRERRRITLDDVSRETGISRPTVGRISGTPGYVTTTDTVEALCRYFECSPSDLMVLVDASDGRKPDGHFRSKKRK